MPDSTEWVGLLPVRSSIEDPAGARQAVDRTLEAASCTSPFEWIHVIASDEDGKPVAFATDLLAVLPAQTKGERVAQVFLFDIHSRMSAWCLTAAWRAAELGEALVEDLSRMRPLPARCSKVA